MLDLSKGEDIIGSVFNMVTVIEKVSNDIWGNAVYLCRCECGKRFNRVSQSIRNPKVKSCGCWRKRRGENSSNWKGAGDLGSSYICHIKTHARVR
ncbi:hypothetical protein LCGC14_2908960, partial [marine sediment metagenome]